MLIQTTCKWCRRHQRRQLIVRWSQLPTCSCSLRTKKPTTRRNIRRWTTTSCGGSWWKNSTASVNVTRSELSSLIGRIVNWLHFAIWVKPTFLTSDVRALCCGICFLNWMNHASYYSLLNIAALKNITVTLDDCLDRYYGLGELSNFCTVVMVKSVNQLQPLWLLLVITKIRDRLKNNDLLMIAGTFGRNGT